MTQLPHKLKETIMTGGRRQRVIVQRISTHGDPHAPVCGGDEWMAMFPSGRVEHFDLAHGAAAAIRRFAKRGNRTVTVTTIEWRDVPEGWKPPTP